MDRAIASSGPASPDPSGMPLRIDAAGKGFARWASLGLVGVLLFLVSFAIWTARGTNQQVREAAISVLQSDAYASARSAVAEEDFWVTEYLLKLGPVSKHIDSKTARRRHRGAARSMTESLAEIEQTGDVRDRRFVAGVLKSHRTYLEAAAGLFDAIDEGDSKVAIDIELRVIDPLFAQIEEQVARESAAHRSAALAQLAAMRRSERVVYIATVFAFLIGFILVLTLMLTLRTLSRRAEHVVQIELARLEQAALIDSLTSLRNRRGFHEDLMRELARVSRSGHALSVAMLDLRGLKRVNDSLGHQEGDEQLKTLARVLRKTMRGSDAVYRIGGDEFAVILVGENGGGALQVIQRLQIEVGVRPGPRVVFAAGIAEAVDGLAQEALLRRADLALIESKRSRRGVVVYDRELEPSAA
jgi:diguanylate cyclase (GGDEF)-like protein